MNLNRFLVNMISRFIPSSKKRKEFRKKYRNKPYYSRSLFETLFLSNHTLSKLDILDKLNTYMEVEKWNNDKI